MQNQNRYHQVHCIADHAGKATDKCVADLAAVQSEGKIDLLIAFAAGYPPAELDGSLTRLQSETGATHVIGCSCESVIGGALELEHEKAISLWAAELPTARIDSFHLKYARQLDGGAIVGWPDDFESGWKQDSTLIVLGDPYSFPAEVMLEQLNEEHPGIRIVGGMASGADQPDETRLLCGSEVHREGLVGVRISGAPIAMIVSQGCRPIGEPMVITSAERNVIQSLGGKPAFGQLKAVFDQLPTREKQLVQNGLHVGRVINEYQESFSYGDFLIRNVVALDEQLQTISIGDYVRPGQTVQFHIRDADSASAELDQMLAGIDSSQHKSALLFTCNGRGLNLFSDPNHDAEMIQKRMHHSGRSGAVPLAGFFAAGEIGPVGQNNFIHGFTASLALFG